MSESSALDDDQLIANVLNDKPTAGGNPLENITSRPLETGEKAEGAVDYEDIELDDLPDDEEATGGSTPKAAEDDQDEDLFGEVIKESGEGAEVSSAPSGEGPVEDEFDLDDLFGDGDDSGNTGVDEPPRPGSVAPDIDAPSLAASKTVDPDPVVAPEPEVEEYDPEYEQQLALLGLRNPAHAPSPPPPPETMEEALLAMFPKYRKDEVPRFLELLPPKKHHYVGKPPWKIPRRVQPSKIDLDLAIDQEREFRTSLAANPKKKRTTIHNAIISFADTPSDSDAPEEIVDEQDDFDQGMINGVTWNDLEMLCQDWEIASCEDSSNGDLDMLSNQDSDADADADADAEWDREFGIPPAKRVKVDQPHKDLFAAPIYSIPSFDDPELATAKIAKKVVLDLNDPWLLVDTTSGALNRETRAAVDAKARTSREYLKSRLKRYNISNDEAYNTLRENQSSSRSMLGALKVSHSMPALRMQWPFYKTKLGVREARSFHRPQMKFHINLPVRFSRPRKVNRKLLKKQETSELYVTTKDVSLADNSDLLLLEYSEEYPTIMQNFGMSSRIMNYYRRKEAQDTNKPKLDIGEAMVLHPQDQSPFWMFGFVDPGETVQTLYNEMFRAPLYKHESPATDFLVIRNSTGVDGSSWYMRNIKHICVVGQELPAVTVPKPSSRALTNAARVRILMIAYNCMRRHRNLRCKLSTLSMHEPGTQDVQMKLRLKEILDYHKEDKTYSMKGEAEVPDAPATRSMLKPEEICLLEATQVGQRQLEDAGYANEADEGQEEDLQQQLAPWTTTSNFLAAVEDKGMLKLHGEGDPTGRGEGINMIRTSMKGGYRAEGESAAAKMDAKKSKDKSGHSYNVNEQKEAYRAAIRRIWEAQKTSLSTTVEHSEMEVDDEVASDDLFGEVATPRSVVPTPVTASQRGDDEQSQVSRMSTASQGVGGRTLKIHRKRKARGGGWEEETEVIKDQRVIREYLKRRHTIEAERTVLSELVPTGDLEQDQRNEQRLREELLRLNRNRDRRLARDKQKGIVEPSEATGSPRAADFDMGDNTPTDGAGTPIEQAGGGGGTKRKCANCGQVGHIKTNKKLCPMLNGTAPPPDAGVGGFGVTAKPKHTAEPTYPQSDDPWTNPAAGASFP